MLRTKALSAAVAAFAQFASTAPGYGEDKSAFGPMLEGFSYAIPVQNFAFESQRQPLQMAFIDTAPPGYANGKTIVLLHGKNFCAGTWVETIRHLVRLGYRVVAPDQIGFCKSSKPRAYHFSFRALAQNTHDLLVPLGIEHAVMLGHSTGGMLAIRYALMYPEATDQLLLVDPIGLEDWNAEGVPPVSIDQWYARDLKTTDDTIRAYEQATYYAGTGQPRFEPWVQMLAGLYRGPGRDAVAWDSALIYDMIMTQPVVYELSHLRVPTVLMIGDKDITAIGKDLAPPAVRASLGIYQALGQAAAAAIPGAKLIEFAALGHAPQIQDPDAFHAALRDALDGSLPARSVQ